MLETESVKERKNNRLTFARWNNNKLEKLHVQLKVGCSGIYLDGAARHRSIPVTDCTSRALRIAFDYISPTTLTLPSRALSDTVRRRSGATNEKKKGEKKLTRLTLMLYRERRIDKSGLKTRRNFREKQFCENSVKSGVTTRRRIRVKHTTHE